jgi:hypothetical protein
MMKGLCMKGGDFETGITGLSNCSLQCLWSLAKKHYGNPLLWTYIADANGISDETDIPAGTPIRIPLRKLKGLHPCLTNTNGVSDRSYTPVGITTVEEAERTDRKPVNGGISRL